MLFDWSLDDPETASSNKSFLFFICLCFSKSLLIKYTLERFINKDNIDFDEAAA